MALLTKLFLEEDDTTVCTTGGGNFHLMGLTNFDTEGLSNHLARSGALEASSAPLLLLVDELPAMNTLTNTTNSIKIHYYTPFLQ